MITENTKKCFLKKIITGDNAIKTKRLTQIQVLTKKVYQTKVTQLLKPINYWEIATNTQSN